MSELREHIIDLVEHNATVDDIHQYRGAPEIADAILAAVAEALTSPEVVEAGAAGQFGGMYGWGILNPHRQDDEREFARDVITAALRAAGVKGEGDA